jgi:hypothetical protein
MCITVPIIATPTRAPICRLALSAAAALLAFALPATSITVAVMPGIAIPMATFITTAAVTSSQ